MRRYEEQKKEIQTIKGRQLTIELSDADVHRICERAGQSGITVAELLQNFIGDLVGGTYSNGSDERDYANRWFERCCFGMMTDETFLKYLLYISCVDDALSSWNSLSENRIELKQTETRLQEADITEDDITYIQEDINCLNEEISYHTEELAEFFEDYKKSGGTDVSLEAGMEKVLQWQAEKERLATTVTNVSQPLAEVNARGMMKEVIEADK